jgi:membrane associated rhomboid family serine protease
MTPWVTRLLIANVAVFFLQQSAPGLTEALELVPAELGRHPWTMVTYMFLHGNISHIVFNMLSLYFFGPRVEARLGGPNFIALYFISGMSGALLSLATPYSQIVGASGAIFGIMLVFATYWPHERVFIWGAFPVEARTLVMVMTGYAVFGGMAGAQAAGGIAHYAHLGGFAGGFLFMRWLHYRSPAEEFRRKVEGRRPASEREDLRRWATIRREGLHQLNLAELDRLTAKIESSGVKSLTAEERAFLDRLSKE